ncbi:nuclear transport factor 2 family protein [Streptomyces althioticus]|uniref:nuclear transport factor 2 family protein n=1 Tax=Streptomyces althioticus group TaxID=2867194 RepID=UPI0035119E52|nr:nuclear transport factor 2 family protein [Streptomyces althioticus]
MTTDRDPRTEPHPSTRPAFPPPPPYPPSAAFTAGDGAMMAGRDIRNSAGRDINNVRRTKIGGGWGIALVALLLAGVGGGVYVATDGDSGVSGVGAQEGEAGVRETWEATAAAVRAGDSASLCTLMTPDFRKEIENRASGDCVASIGELFASSDASRQDAGAGQLESVTVRGRWAEVVEVWPESTEPSYRYMERFGDRWRWTHHFHFSAFHPDECPEFTWNNPSPSDRRCSQQTIFS